MQIHRLRYFITLVEKHSFTTAASECFITQSALSQQIKALEEELEVSLVKRHGRNFEITPSGKLLYERSLLLVKEIDDLSKQVQRVNRNIGCTLRLGLLSSMDNIELPAKLKEMVLNRTGYDLSLQYGSHDELYELFGTGCLNAFISYENRLNATESFSKTKLFATKVYAEIPTSIEIPSYSTNKLKIDINELSNFNLILICEEEHLLEEQQYLSLLFNQSNLSCQTALNIQEGRKLALQQPNSALIVDRSLLRGDFSTHNKLFRYEVISQGKAIKRPLSCFARKNFDQEELLELCHIIMELGQKKAALEQAKDDLISYQDNQGELSDSQTSYPKHHIPL